MSDNGPQFIASEFVDFLKQNGIKQMLVPPHHPPSDGAAECTVQVLKQASKKRPKEYEEVHRSGL